VNSPTLDIECVSRSGRSSELEAAKLKRIAARAFAESALRYFQVLVLNRHLSSSVSSGFAKNFPPFSTARLSRGLAGCHCLYSLNDLVLLPCKWGVVCTVWAHVFRTYVANREQHQKQRNNAW